ALNLTLLSKRDKLTISRRQCIAMAKVSKVVNRNEGSNSGVLVRVAGTSPLSFDVTVGTTLQVREFAPSSPSRPTIGGRFKSSAFLLFRDRTKVGRLSPASLRKLGNSVPPVCTVVEVDRNRGILLVTFN